MQVGTERKRPHAGIENALGDLEAEMRAVTDIDAMRADVHLMALPELIGERRQLRLVDIGEREIGAAGGKRGC